MLLQLHNGGLTVCRALPKDYVLMEESDWYLLYLPPLAHKIPECKTYLPFPGLLWGTPIVDVLDATTKESAQYLIQEKANDLAKLWVVWKTPSRIKKGDTTTRKRVRKASGKTSDSEIESESEGNEEVTDKSEQEDEVDVSESDACVTDDDELSDPAFHSDDNEEHYEEDPPETPQIDIEIDDATDFEDD